MVFEALASKSVLFAQGLLFRAGIVIQILHGLRRHSTWAGERTTTHGLKALRELVIKSNEACLEVFHSGEPGYASLVVHLGIRPPAYI
jgi:hypothetical protein